MMLFDAKAAELEHEMKARHADDLLHWRNKMANSDLRPRFSAHLLNLRQVQANLAKQRLCVPSVPRASELTRGLLGLEREEREWGVGSKATRKQNRCFGCDYAPSNVFTLTRACGVEWAQVR